MDNENLNQPTNNGATSSRPDDSSKEWKLIEKVVMEMQGEQRRTRRWGIFFKLAFLLYLLTILFMVRLPTENLDKAGAAESYAAVIEVNGVIAADQDASADAIISALRDAFKDEKALGVILRINSPGGSPVQSG